MDMHSDTTTQDTTTQDTTTQDTNEDVFESWDHLDIDPDILRGIFSYGFEIPSNIQKKAIIPMIKKRDVIAQAQSGTGKTAAFSVGSLARVDLSQRNCQVLIMSPTHELTHQIATVIGSLSSAMKGLVIKTIVGGSSMNEDVAQMRQNPPHIIVGCPGRVYDMMTRRHLNLSTVKLAVLDEADEMLSSGFSEQVYNIFQGLNSSVQFALFSATLPDNIMQIANTIMKNPVIISVKSESLTLEGIKQYYIAMEDDLQKYRTIKDLYSSLSVSQCIIYCNSVKRVVDLYNTMCADQFPVCCIHSNMDKNEREKTITDFRSGSSRVLISSNVTARGIDIQQVSIVINFDLSKDIYTYLHRIGRSGRWGRKGMGITFVTRRDIDTIKEIERYYETQIDELPANFLVDI